ncbi:MAG: hypothetical protein FWF82_05850, partial [Oscillospiraceae bacterium]|nr:hypothetical protein [Oscillospiraceae bacterium]
MTADFISGILPPQKCVECKECCVFDKDDIWEVGDFVKVTQKANLFVCENLTANGCGLGSRKPPECALYPFRVMTFEGKRVLTLSKFCKGVGEKSMTEIIKFAEEKSGDFAAVAKNNPDIIK